MNTPNENSTPPYDSETGTELDMATPDSSNWLSSMVSRIKLPADNHNSAKEAVVFANQQLHTNPQQALFWFEYAASHGQREGIRGIGQIHEHGIGVVQDFKKAADHYAQAAEHGDVIAQYLLGRLLISGLVEGGSPLGCFWLILAASEGHKQAAELRDITLRAMPVSQILRALRAAQEWSKWVTPYH